MAHFSTGKPPFGRPLSGSCCDCNIDVASLGLTDGTPLNKQYHLTTQPVPAGFRIYEEGVAIPDIQHHREAAREFCRASNQRIEFAPEPHNDHNGDGIAIIGSWPVFLGRKSRKLGYVPRDIVARLEGAKLTSVVRARLLKTYLNSDDSIDIEFQVLGPSDKYRIYRPISEDDPFEQVKPAKASGDYDTAMNILADLIAATETQSKKTGEGVAPLAYLEAAKILRRMNLHDEERIILERYEAQTKAPGSLPIVLSERLAKIRRTQIAARGKTAH